jgi:hypothetical protein
MGFSSTFDLAKLTPKYLRENYLIGLVLKGADGQELSDAVLQDHLDSAFAKVEGITNVDILQHVYVAEKHDYHVDDYQRYGFLQLFHLPIFTVQEIRAVYPTGQTIQVFPQEWMRIEPSHSQINLIPTSGTLSQVIIGHGGDYLPLIYSGLGYLPGLWEVDYTAGFDPAKMPRLIIDVVCKYAVIELLQKMSDLINPLGLQNSSLSVDGLSQSRGYMAPAFKGRIDSYKADLGMPGPNGEPLGGLLREIRNNYMGVNMASM